MQGAVSGQGVAYCFLVRDGRSLASSFPGTTPRVLVDARRAGDIEPFTVVSGQTRYLDLVEPMLNGRVGVVRVGVDLLAPAGAETLVAEGWSGGKRIRVDAALTVVARRFPVQELSLPRKMRSSTPPR